MQCLSQVLWAVHVDYSHCCDKNARLSGLLRTIHHKYFGVFCGQKKSFCLSITFVNLLIYFCETDPGGMFLKSFYNSCHFYVAITANHTKLFKQKRMLIWAHMYEEQIAPLLCLSCKQ